MTDSKTSLTLFGETLELRTSLLMGAGVPINGFFTNGQTVADLALIRPYDGLVQFNDAVIGSTVDVIRQRNSTGYRLFFAVATPILLLIDMIFAVLRGIGRVFAAMSVFGIFSAILGLVALAVIYLVRMSYRSGNEDAVRKIKEACHTLARRLPHDAVGA